MSSFGRLPDPCQGHLSHQRYPSLRGKNLVTSHHIQQNWVELFVKNQLLCFGKRKPYLSHPVSLNSPRAALVHWIPLRAFSMASSTSSGSVPSNSVIWNVRKLHTRSHNHETLKQHTEWAWRPSMPLAVTLHLGCMAHPSLSSRTELLQPILGVEYALLDKWNQNGIAANLSSEMCFGTGFWNLVI